MTKKDIEKLNALKRKQKAINKKRAEFKKQILENKELVFRILKEDEEKPELGRMLTERFPGITPDTFDEFIASKATGNEVLPTPR